MADASVSEVQASIHYNHAEAMVKLKSGPDSSENEMEYKIVFVRIGRAEPLEVKVTCTS